MSTDVIAELAAENARLRAALADTEENAAALTSLLTRGGFGPRLVARAVLAALRTRAGIEGAKP